MRILYQFRNPQRFLSMAPTAEQELKIRKIVSSYMLPTKWDNILMTPSPRGGSISFYRESTGVTVGELQKLCAQKLYRELLTVIPELEGAL